MPRSVKRYRILPGSIPEAVPLEDFGPATSFIVRDKVEVKGSEFRIVDDNGEIFWTDEKISQLLNAAKALRESEEKNRLLMENSGLGIGYFSTDGKILMFNQEAVKKLGGKVSEYIGENLTCVYGTETGKLIIDRLKLAAGSEVSLQFEDSIKIAGNEIWYLSTYTRILNEVGNVDGIQVITNDITERKTAEKKLMESQKMLQKLASHLEEIMENERSQIALNLHDDLGQKLTAINMNIAWVKGRIGVQSPAVRKKLEEMTQLINETIENIKEISSFLRPLILFDLGLVPAFDSLLKKFQKQSGIRCTFVFNHEDLQIDKRISLTLYRILQESLTNIARHSEASEAEVRLRSLKNKVELQINDNGKGINDDEVDSFTSMGIAGVKERVSSVNGSLVIKGKKGLGTRIKVSIPLIRGSKND